MLLAPLSVKTSARAPDGELSVHCVGRAGGANPIQQNDVPSFFLSMLRSLVPSALLGVIASARADKTNQRIDVNVVLSGCKSARAMRRALWVRCVPRMAARLGGSSVDAFSSGT
jgi:hypothetical protein